MPKLLRISSVVLSALLGLVFLYSAYSKLWPLVETFEFMFVDFGIGNWYTAPVFARLIIALEFFTGILLLVSYRTRTFTIPLCFIILIVFSVFLGFQIYNGNNDNCGCFGNHLPMSPAAALLKNFIMLLVAAFIYRVNFTWHNRYEKLLLSLLFVSICTVILILNPIDYSYSTNNLEEKVGYPLQLDLLYDKSDTLVEAPTTELRKGKHVLAFLSLTCPHCRIAATKFRIIKKEFPELPLYFVLNGDKSRLADFYSDTHTENIPHSFCSGPTFIKLAAFHLPRIYYIDSSVVVKKVDYFEVNQYHIENWLRTGKAE